VLPIFLTVLFICCICIFIIWDMCWSNPTVKTLAYRWAICLILALFQHCIVFVLLLSLIPSRQASCHVTFLLPSCSINMLSSWQTVSGISDQSVSTSIPVPGCVSENKASSCQLSESLVKRYSKILFDLICMRCGCKITGLV
jgi:hypothetical protein